MKEYVLTNREKLRRIDPVVLFCALGMNLMGIVTLAAASDFFGTWYVTVQSIVSVLGIAVMILL